MLGDRRIVFVLRAERLLKPKRAAKAASAPAAGDEDEEATEGEEPADTVAIEEYLADPAPTTSLIFVAADIDRTRRLTKRLVEQAIVTEFDGPLLGEVRPAFETRAARRPNGFRPSWPRPAARSIREALAELVVRAGNDITKLRGDVERLVLFPEGRKRITAR